jgi:hypothetical protein
MRTQRETQYDDLTTELVRVCQLTLLHGETLLVVSTTDSDDVALELVTELVNGNILTHSLLPEDSGLEVIVDGECLLSASGGVGEVQLHDEDCPGTKGR